MRNVCIYVRPNNFLEKLVSIAHLVPLQVIPLDCVLLFVPSELW